MPRTEPTGRVSSRAQVKGLVCRQFVARDWRSPLPHHYWYVCDPAIPEDAAEIEAYKASIPVDYRSRWYGEGGKIVADELASFHPVLRPVLVVIAGFR